MVAAKRAISILMVIVLLIGCFSSMLNVSAATTSSKFVVQYNALSGGTVTAQTHSYVIKSNFWTKKKITIYGTNKFPNKTTLNSFTQLAKFDVAVKDKRGKTISSYRNVSLGFKLYLPKWKKENYTVTVTSKFNGYKRGNSYHQTAALTGKYYLKY